MLCCTMPCWWKRKPQNVPSPWDFVTPLKEDRATAICIIHKNLVKIARVVREISSRADRHIDRQTHTDGLITILHIAAAGEVIISRASAYGAVIMWLRKFTRRNGHEFDFDPRTQHYRSVGTGMGDGLRAGIPPRYVTSNPGQLSLPSSVGRELSTGQRAVMRCGWGVKAG